MTTQTTFLTPNDIAELTGIKRGRNNRTREQCQVAALAKMRIPHYVNAAGKPIVARAVIEGSAAAKAQEPTSWEPSLG